MTIQERVSVRIGQRVKFKPSLATPGEGVVVAVSRENGKENGISVEENHIRWDSGSLSWEMRADLLRIPNREGDTFVSSGGMGIRSVEVEGVNATKISRDVAERTSRSELVLLTMFGVLPKVRRKVVLTPARELTLEIRKRVANGYPLKGGCGNRKPGKTQLELAKVIATGVPIASAENPGSHSTTLKRVKTTLGWAARAMKLGPKSIIKRHSKW